MMCKGGDYFYDASGNCVYILERGGSINSSLMDEASIDEFSLLSYPLADDTANVPTLTETDASKKHLALKLTSVEQLENGILWLRYAVQQ